MKNISKHLTSNISIVGFVVVILFFGLTTNGAIFSSVSLQSIINSTMTTGLIATGAVFIFGSGSFDMSLGNSVAVAAVIACYATIATGNLFVGFIVCLAISVLLGALKGIFAAYVDVPLFIVTIVLGTILSSLILTMMGDTVSISLNDAVAEIPSFSLNEMTVINLVVLIIYAGVCIVLFNYTKIGKQVKMVGGNEVVARQSGINIKKVRVLAFLLSSIGCALAAFIILIRVRSVGPTTAGSVGMDLLVAIVLGGMSLTGGSRSKISAGIVGAATISVLNTGLTMLNLDIATIQITRAIIFLIVVSMANMSYKTKLLPR